MADLQPFVPAGEAMASLTSAHPATPFARARHGRRHRPTSHPLPAWFHEPESEHDPRVRPRRSEEHTSELQSLMRISYAVFCLKKKKKQKSKKNHDNITKYTTSDNMQTIEQDKRTKTSAYHSDSH